MLSNATDCPSEMPWLDSLQASIYKAENTMLEQYHSLHKTAHADSDAESGCKADI